MTEAGYAIHWLRYSTSAAQTTICDAIGGKWSDTTGRGAFNQPFNVMHGTGARVYFGSRRPDQPNVVEVPGEACEADVGRFLQAMDAVAGRPTRYDVAADVEPADLARRRIREMHAAFRRGTVETNIRRKPELIRNDNEGEGWTLYLGSKRSPSYCRAYDRRGPLRIEWQNAVHRSVAGAVKHNLLQMKPQQLWQMNARLTLYPMDWYHELIDPTAEALPPKEPTAADFLQMIENTRKSWGVVLWMLQTMGVEPTDLARKPENPSGEMIARCYRIAKQATANGYDGQKLLDAIEGGEVKRTPRQPGAADTTAES